MENENIIEELETINAQQQQSKPRQLSGLSRDSSALFYEDELEEFRGYTSTPRSKARPDTPRPILLGPAGQADLAEATARFCSARKRNSGGFAPENITTTNQYDALRGGIDLSDSSSSQGSPRSVKTNKLSESPPCPGIRRIFVDRGDPTDSDLTLVRLVCSLAQRTRFGTALKTPFYFSTLENGQTFVKATENQFTLLGDCLIVGPTVGPSYDITINFVAIKEEPMEGAYMDRSFPPSPDFSVDGMDKEIHVGTEDSPAIEHWFATQKRTRVVSGGFEEGTASVNPCSPERKGDNQNVSDFGSGSESDNLSLPVRSKFFRSGRSDPGGVPDSPTSESREGKKSPSSDTLTSQNSGEGVVEGASTKDYIFKSKPKANILSKNDFLRTTKVSTASQASKRKRATNNSSGETCPTPGKVAKPDALVATGGGCRMPLVADIPLPRAEVRVADQPTNPPTPKGSNRSGSQLANRVKDNHKGMVEHQIPLKRLIKTRTLNRCGTALQIKLNKDNPNLKIKNIKRWDNNFLEIELTVESTATEIKVEGKLYHLHLMLARPTKCTHCLRWGHSKKYCRDLRFPPNCSRCGQAHTNKDFPCTRRIRCANCRGNHYTQSQGCPAYQKAVKFALTKAGMGDTVRSTKHVSVDKNLIKIPKPVRYTQVRSGVSGSYANALKSKPLDKLTPVPKVSTTGNPEASNKEECPCCKDINLRDLIRVLAGMQIHCQTRKGNPPSETVIMDGTLMACEVVNQSLGLNISAMEILSAITAHYKKSAVTESVGAKANTSSVD